MLAYREIVTNTRHWICKEVIIFQVASFAHNSHWRRDSHIGLVPVYSHVESQSRGDIKPFFFSDVFFKFSCIVLQSPIAVWSTPLYTGNGCE